MASSESGSRIPRAFSFVGGAVWIAGFFSARRRKRLPDMAHATKLVLEQLEDRYAPATFGNPWPDGAHLTLSLAPDKTQVGDRQSALFSALGAQMTTTGWQVAILKAFQTWAANANLNFALVPDSGLPMGSRGMIQGDPRFGDMRVSAFSFAPTEVGLEE